MTNSRSRIHPDEVATLGDFFVLWGVRLDEHCLGHRCEGDGAPGRLTVTADDWVRAAAARDAGREREERSA